MVRLLIINPGSASTKIAIFENEEVKLEKTIRHAVEEVLTFKNSFVQREYREKFILDFLKESNYALTDFDAFVGRGGLLKPLTSGTYEVNEAMYEDLKNHTYGDHPSNLGAIIALDLAKKVNKKAYMVDPVVVDELSDIARVSGYKGINRSSAFHALNHKAIAKRFSTEKNLKYEDLNLIVVHLGGGISIGLHEKGLVADVNNAAGGDGTFSPERVGALPVFPLIDETLKNLDDITAFKKRLITKSGLYSYLKTSSLMEIQERALNNDAEAMFYLKALAYTINKSIGALYFAANGKVDAVLYTGGIANNKLFMEILTKLLPKEVNYYIYPGEDELKALAEGTLQAIKKDKVKKY